MVNSQLKTLFNLLQRLQRLFNDCITNLSLLGIQNSKLGHHIRVQLIHTITWEQSQGPNLCLPNWSFMNEFLTARVLESVSDITGSHNPNPVSRRTRNSPQENRKFKSFGSMVTATISPKKCPFSSFIPSFSGWQSAKVLMLPKETRFVRIVWQSRSNLENSRALMKRDYWNPRR